MKPVTYPLKLQMKRVAVGDLHKALVFLGLTIADKEKSAQRFGASTRAAVRQFQVDHKLTETGEVDEATAMEINQELADRGVLDVEPGPGGDLPTPNPPTQDPQPGGFYFVVGRVLRGDGPPIGQAVVRAWHKNLRSEIPLGEPALSDNLGRYAIRYLPPDGVRQVDLVVRATDSDPDRQAEIARSDLICRARKREIVDLIAGGVVYRGYSEYERIGKTVQPHLDRVAVGELTVADVEFLECKTNENPIHIAYLAIANHYAWTDVPAGAFYGFFRMGLPTSLSALVSQQVRVQRRALQAALNWNIVPRTLENKIDDILRQLKHIAVKLALEVPEGGESTSLAPLLATTGLSSAQQGALLTRYSLYDGTIEAFWTSLNSDPEFGDPVLIEGLQFTLQLGTLAGGYVPMVQKLQEHRKAGQMSGVQDLAALQHHDWLALVKEAGTPPGIPGETELQRAENYARSLGQTIETAFPTHSIVAGLKRADLPQHKDLLRFFDNSPDFSFEANIDRYLADRGGVAVDGIVDAEQTARELKRMQRVYNVSPQVGRFDAMSALLDAGLDSARTIFRMGQEAFVRSFEGPLGGVQAAKGVYEQAAQTSAHSSSAFGRYSLALSVGTPAVIRNLTAQGAGVPDWESLFGSLSFCECEHCRSVYSPAAYFVDLLQFVKQQPAIRITGGVVTYPTVSLPDGSTRPKNAVDVLFERRNDLGEIQLSCQNTNTLLPYIDLANEVLENAVVRGDTIYQTNWTSEELSANAEHQNDTAYKRLALQVYPRLLPFNLWLLEARTYLEHLSSSLVELMEVLHRPGRTGGALAELERQIAIESLGLSPVTAQIITGEARSALSPWDFWGVISAGWPDSLADLPTFLKQAEIEYTTLDALNKTEFINADDKLRVNFKTPCNVEGATIEHLTETVLDRMHRFLRMQQATGWEISELDAAITAMKAADLTMTFLVQAAKIKRLQGDLDRPLLEMLSWWSTISTVVDETNPEDRSFYDELFLNNTVLSPVDEVFQLNSARSDLKNASTAPLGEHKPTILSALAVTEADFGLILSGISKTESDTLTLELLSQLYRRASFARALKLPVSDFFAIRELTGIDPFENPQTAIQFTKEAEAIAQSNFSIATLDYLLRHVYTETSGLAPAESGIILLLDGIKAGLQAVAAENVYTSDPTGEITRGRLALLLTGDDLTEAISIIENTSTQSQAEQEDFIDAHFADFLDVSDAKEKLVGESALPGLQARYEYMLSPLVIYLKTTLSTQVIVQAIAVALGLETAVCEAMLTQYVVTPSDYSKKAIDTFLNIDLEGETYAASMLDTYRLLHKIATLIVKLKATADELVWIFEKGPSLGWLDLKDLPFTVSGDTDASHLYGGWRRLMALYDFRDRYPTAGDVTVFSVLALVDSGNDRESVLATLSSLTGWDAGDLDDLTGPNGFNLVFPAGFGDERYLVHLEAAFDLLTRLGVAAAAARDWKAFDNLGQMKTAATAIKSTVKAKYDNDAWLTVAEPLKNQLREVQRSALIAHLISRRPDIEEASDLFEHYLIDAEMNACMKTSRIKQAISSVQLFVQRCLMNLEPNVEITALSASQWEWMKNYRVWEANRKIFLYPENWIVPELRDDKSPFFKELENELLQNEITQETAEKVLLNYLEKLDEVGNLDVRALYHQKENGDVPTDVLHVFARTHSTPYVHYYRKFVDSAYWTAWEKVDIDIEGDHLLAVVWNRRLYLMWPLIEEETQGEEACTPLSELLEAEFPRLLNDRNSQEWEELKNGWLDPNYEPGLIELLKSQELDLPEQTDWLENLFAQGFPEINFEDMGSVLQEWLDCRATNNKLSKIQLAWSEFKDGTWSAEKVGEGLVEILYRAQESFVFKPEIDQSGLQMEPWDSPILSTRLFALPRQNGDLVVTCYSSDDLAKSAHGSFRFTGCNGRVVVTVDDGQPTSPAHLFPLPSSMRYMQLVEAEEVDLSLMVPSSTVDSKGNWAGSLRIDYPVVLDKTPGQFILALPHQYNEYVSQDAFFYQDERRCFHIVPRNQSPLLTVLQDVNSIFFEAASRSIIWNPGVAIGGQSGTRGSAPGISRGLIRAKDARVAFGRKSSQARAFGGRSLVEGLLTGAGAPAGGLQIGSATSIVQEKVFKFSSFFHPHLCTFMEELNAKGIDGLMDRSIQARSNTFFESTYFPNQDVVPEPYPILNVDFSNAGAYSQYNWEIFFHVPLLIAANLSLNQRFDEAQAWFHYIFNPMARTDSAAVTGPERYWNFLPFYEENAPRTIDELMLELNEGDAELEAQVEAWRENPFNPHLIARMRPIAYQKTVVMKYLDNLIAWGDNLFRRDTIESINEATQLYVMAAKILGPRPLSLPADAVEDLQTYNSLADKLDAFSNALVQIENQVPPLKRPVFDPFGGFFPPPPIMFPLPLPLPLPNVETLYFCVPKNEQLNAYWDTVADRLFKIRNCMNIEGVVRELALFEPPISPELLVRAAAAGIDISSALSDLYAPPPKYRFQTLMRNAMELCADVRSLGAALLSALEKQDAEALALLRADHEMQLLESMKQTRESQIDEANESLQGLTRAREVSAARLTYYEQLLAAGLSPYESVNLVHMSLSRTFEKKAGDYELRAARNYRIPDVSVTFGKPFWPPIPQSIGTSTGGSFLGNNARARAAKQRNLAANESFVANIASITGGYARRKQDWQYQVDAATKEVAQIDKQIAAAEIRVAIAEQELDNHSKQIEHAQEIYNFVKDKYTTDQLYIWMVSQISSIYFQSYQMAYDLAKRAEKAYQHELGLSASSFITFGYWDSLKKGLLSGEKLNYDLRRMEMSYLDQNKREYELTRHVSLALLDPVALLNLSTEGECAFSIPEAAFDLDFPGHYMRRIKSVSMTIPCVTGPYTSVSCCLTLTGDKTRKETSTTGGYAYTGPEDSRFVHNYIGQSISTSSGQNDGGVFELSFHDERYLPFEGRGAISDWILKLTSAVPTFDWSSITDIVLHLSYTAREGGDLLRDAAVGTSQDPDGGLGGRLPLRRGFSAKHEFSAEWSAFLRPAQDVNEAVLKLDLSAKRFPFFARNLGLAISELQLVALVKEPANWTDIESVKIFRENQSEAQVTLASSKERYAGHPSASVSYAEGDGAGPGEWTITVPTMTMGAPSEWIEDFIVVATYKLTLPD